MAPELDVHMALVFANPTVEPIKSTPLKDDEEKKKEGLDVLKHELIRLVKL